VAVRLCFQFQVAAVQYGSGDGGDKGVEVAGGAGHAGGCAGVRHGHVLRRRLRRRAPRKNAAHVDVVQSRVASDESNQNDLDVSSS
jgi:hypothetical protein